MKGFVVEKGTPGFSPVAMKDKIALRVVQNAHISLEGVRVPEANRLQNASSFRDTAAVLRLTRAGVAWQAVGCARGELVREFLPDPVLVDDRFDLFGHELPGALDGIAPGLIQ